MEEKEKVCKRETEIYSRVTGYHRPVKNWNKGKKAEFSERVYFDKWIIKTKTGNKKYRAIINDKGEGEIEEVNE